MKDFTFLQSMNVRNKTWNTGCWKRKLLTIATSKKMPFAANPKSQARAQYILDRRDNKTKTPKPSSGLGFFPFEEQLYHHTSRRSKRERRGGPIGKKQMSFRIRKKNMGNWSRLGIN